MGAGTDLGGPERAGTGAYLQAKGKNFREGGFAYD